MLAILSSAWLRSPAYRKLMNSKGANFVVVLSTRDFPGRTAIWVLYFLNSESRLGVNTDLLHWSYFWYP